MKQAVKQTIKSFLWIIVRWIVSISNSRYIIEENGRNLLSYTEGPCEQLSKERIVNSNINIMIYGGKEQDQIEKEYSKILRPMYSKISKQLRKENFNAKACHKLIMESLKTHKDELDKIDGNLPITA